MNTARTVRSVDERPGTFGLTTVHGPTGAFIRAGQFLMGDGSKWGHAFINLGGDEILEAVSTGARITTRDTLAGREVAYSWPIVLTDDERARIVAIARTKVGAPYSFVAFAHLALTALGIRWGWLQRRLAASRARYCSQLVDDVYALAGVVLFDDGRAPFDVKPSALVNGLITRDWRARVPAGWTTPVDPSWRPD